MSVQNGVNIANMFLPTPKANANDNVPDALKEVRMTFDKLKEDSRELLDLWMKRESHSKEENRYIWAIFNKVDCFDPSHVVMEDGDIQLLRELYAKLHACKAKFTDLAISPIVTFLRSHFQRIETFHALDQNCKDTLDALREKEKAFNILSKRKADRKSARTMDAMQKLQDAQSEHDIAMLDFMKSVKDSQSEMAFHYFRLVCKHALKQLDEFGKGHELLMSTSKILMEYDGLITAKENAYHEIKKSKDLQIKQLRDLTSNDSKIMNKKVFLATVKTMIQPDCPPLYEGEIVCISQSYVIYVYNQRFTGGILFVTNCRLIFLPYTVKITGEEDETLPWLQHDVIESSMNPKPWFSVAFGSIGSIDCFGKDLLTISDKHLATYLISFRHTSVKVSEFRLVLSPIVWGKIASLDKKTSNLEESSKSKEKYAVFATTHAKAVSENKFTSDSWFDPRNDYYRLRMDNSDGKSTEWTLVHNVGFKLSPTYPEWFVVPALASYDLIKEVSHFRRKERLPAAMWCRRYNHCIVSSYISEGLYQKEENDLGVPATPAIYRCSQPRPGLYWARSKADEKYLQIIGRSVNSKSSETKTVYILDCRPKANAIANLARGGGWESKSYYKNCSIDFLNIENIHVVRDSFKELKSLFDNLPSEKGRPAVIQGSTESSNVATNRYKIIIKTLSGGHASWFSHLSTIIAGAVRIVEVIIEKQSSVVLHCSDGWDRTPQVSALAQILLDPYYRTMHGMAYLIEKEWISFGHKFARRYGHGNKRKKVGDTQRSPVFIQWLDCVYQLLHQFPESFEFNAEFLSGLAEHVHSCIFGNFLCDSEAERSRTKIRSRSLSIWQLLCNSSKFKNENFKASSDTEVLKANYSPGVFVLFLPLYRRWDTSRRPRPLPTPSSIYIQAPKIMGHTRYRNISVSSQITEDGRKHLFVDPTDSPQISKGLTPGTETSTSLSSVLTSTKGMRNILNLKNRRRLMSLNTMSIALKDQDSKNRRGEVSRNREVLRSEWMEAENGNPNDLLEARRNSEGLLVSMSAVKVDALGKLDEIINLAMEMRKHVQEYDGETSSVKVAHTWLDKAYRKLDCASMAIVLAESRSPMDDGKSVAYSVASCPSPASPNTCTANSTMKSRLIMNKNYTNYLADPQYRPGTPPSNASTPRGSTHDHRPVSPLSTSGRNLHTPWSGRSSPTLPVSSFPLTMITVPESPVSSSTMVTPASPVSPTWSNSGHSPKIPKAKGMRTHRSHREANVGKRAPHHHRRKSSFTFPVERLTLSSNVGNETKFLSNSRFVPGGNEVPSLIQGNPSYGLKSSLSTLQRSSKAETDYPVQHRKMPPPPPPRNHKKKLRQPAEDSMSRVTDDGTVPDEAMLPQVSSRLSFDEV